MIRGREREGGRERDSDTDETADYIEISNANVIIERVNEVSLSL